MVQLFFRDFHWLLGLVGEQVGILLPEGECLFILIAFHQELVGAEDGFDHRNAAEGVGPHQYQADDKYCGHWDELVLN